MSMDPSGPSSLYIYSQYIEHGMTSLLGCRYNVIAMIPVQIPSRLLLRLLGWKHNPPSYSGRYRLSAPLEVEPDLTKATVNELSSHIFFHIQMKI